jgi:hypothetical protein
MYRKLPLGIQDFQKLRTNGYLYVDKSAYIYQMTRECWPYFLGRPRRFGKSLLVSTLKAYFLGKKELFEGLAIAELEKDWLEYPVIYIDLNRGYYTRLQSLQNVLSAILDDYERRWEVEVKFDDLPIRFSKLIEAAHEKTGRNVVVLIDEYDRPLVNTMDNEPLNDNLRELLKGFYGVLKSMDTLLRFVFLTGVTKFSKLSIFSELNHLTDISLDEEYSGICGISETELKFFEPEIRTLADKLGMTYSETLDELKKHYNGYHFARKSEGMYNPYSLLRVFNAGELNNYWFETGTPTVLVLMLKKTDFNVKGLEDNVKIASDDITNYRAGGTNLTPLLYQTGYLTIKNYNPQLKLYLLGFPNEEVKYGFYRELLPAYMLKTDLASEFYVGYFIEDLQEGNVEGFMTRLKAFFGSISYELNNKTEKDYQTVFYLLFKLMGQFIEAEPRSAAGRADAVVKTADTVYVFEFKLTGNGTAETALKQIDDKGYLIPYTADSRRLVKIGVAFSLETKGIKQWLSSLC